MMALTLTWSGAIVAAGGATVLLVFCATFWKYIGGPAYLLAQDAQFYRENRPHLAAIARELTPDDGESIHDRVSTIRSDVKKAATKAEEAAEAATSAQNDAAAAAALAAVAATKAEAAAEAAKGFEEYVHRFVHETKNTLTILQGAAHVTLAQEDERQTAIRTTKEESS